MKAFIVFLFFSLLLACADQNVGDNTAVATMHSKTEEPAFILPTMVKIPSGVFTLGCDDDTETCNKSQKPLLDVDVPGFEIAITEVTVKEWMLCVDSRKCPPPALEEQPPSDYPVTGVSWYAIQKYIAWLNTTANAHYRLPSEVEWEYVFDTGNTHNTNDRRLKPVGSSAANDYGVYDLSDNVFEFMQDCYLPFHKDNASHIPIKLNDCRRYVRRGYSWKKNSIGNRFGAKRNYTFEHGGFRLARSL